MSRQTNNKATAEGNYMSNFIARYFTLAQFKELNGNISSGNSTKNGLRLPIRQAYQGQALIPVTLFILMGVMLLGVVVEAGNLFIAQRHLQNDADAAAAWGAMQLDIGGLRLSDGSNVHVLSPGDSQVTADRAGQNIIEFMAGAGYGANEWNWQWGRCTMQINIKRKVPTVFVSLVGVREVAVSVAAKARLNNTDQKITCG